jgi:hypothetical protein
MNATIGSKELRMIPYDLDPSLHTAEPESTSLDDGFSPPHQACEDEKEKPREPKSVVIDPALWAKSEF